MKRILALVVVVSLGPVIARADEQTKQIQELLRTQGFFYGDVNGNPGDETTQAIRRFQIRNALPVNGQLDEATRSAILSAGQNSAPSEPSAPTATAPTEPAPPVAAQPPRRVEPPAPTPPYIPPIQNPGPNSSPSADFVPPRAVPTGRPDLRADPSSPPPVQRYPAVPSVPSATIPDGTSTYQGGSRIFSGGPYASAPPFVQSTVIGRAQVLLSREGFYNGPTNGLPNQQLAEAILNYQSVYNLPRSGRLDGTTVAALGIGPVGNPSAPARVIVPRRREYSAPQVAPGVYEGRIVPDSTPR
jgi:peptidoglycan hydrolase-like protein with peptidoglycan-binding domain